MPRMIRDFGPEIQRRAAAILEVASAGSAHHQSRSESFSQSSFGQDRGWGPPTASGPYTTVLKSS